MTIENLVIFFAAFHTLGAALGVGGITFAEILYVKATRDGRVDAREREYVRATFFALRWGMTVVLLAGVALGLLEYKSPGASQGVLFAPLWFQNTLALVIIAAGYALAKGRIPWWFGSSAALVGWWFMLTIDAWRTIPFSYLSLVIAYIVLVFLPGAVLSYLRFLLSESKVAR